MAKRPVTSHTTQCNGRSPLPIDIGTGPAHPSSSSYLPDRGYGHMGPQRPPDQPGEVVMPVVSVEWWRRVGVQPTNTESGQ